MPLQRIYSLFQHQTLAQIPYHSILLPLSYPEMSSTALEVASVGLIDPELLDLEAAVFIESPLPSEPTALDDDDMLDLEHLHVYRGPDPCDSVWQSFSHHYESLNDAFEALAERAYRAGFGIAKHKSNDAKRGRGVLCCMRGYNSAQEKQDKLKTSVKTGCRWRATVKRNYWQGNTFWLVKVTVDSHNHAKDPKQVIPRA